MSALRETRAWQELQAHFEKVRGAHLRDLFAADPERGERLRAEGAGLYLDFSKNRITNETLMLLRGLAHQRGIFERPEAMFRGEHTNVSEHRAVLHVGLRMPRGDVSRGAHQRPGGPSGFASGAADAATPLPRPLWRRRVQAGARDARPD